MTVTVSSFRQHYTEFASGIVYPTTDIQYYLTLAGTVLNASRWASLLDLGTELYIAHNIALEARARKEAANGAPPGGTVGPINNKSVDKVSVGYDTSAGTVEGAGHWNLTIYGTRFIKLARVAGAGPVQTSAGCVPALSGGAWAGPWTSYIPSMNN